MNKRMVLKAIRVVEMTDSKERSRSNVNGKAAKEMENGALVRQKERFRYISLPIRLLF